MKFCLFVGDHFLLCKRLACALDSDLNDFTVLRNRESGCCSIVQCPTALLFLCIFIHPQTKLVQMTSSYNLIAQLE